MSRYFLRSKTKTLVQDNQKLDDVKVSEVKPDKEPMVQKEPMLEEIKEDMFDLGKVVYDPNSIELNDYLDKSKVLLEDVDEDGACLYACLAKALVYNYPELVVSKKSLMNLCREYIQIHQNKMIVLPNNLKMKFKDLIEITHDMDIEKYIKRYTKITTKNWGGLPEIIAVSELFNVEINIFTEDTIGYKREYTIPVDKNPNIHHSIYLLLDLSDELAHYQLIIN